MIKVLATSPQTTPRNYSLEEWDILDETPDQERPDGEATSAQTLQLAPDGLLAATISLEAKLTET